MKKIKYFILIFAIFVLTSCNLPLAGKKINITFDGNGGTLISGIENQKVLTANDIEIPTYEREGYDFVGWTLDIKDITSDSTIRALWQPKPVTVTFDVSGGIMESGYEIQKVEKGEKGIEPPKPTKEGYTFDGWYLNDEKWAFLGYVFTEDTVLVARWIKNTYTITYRNYYGNRDLIINQEYYSSINYVENPVRVGYTFVGWDKDIPEIMPAENIIIEALWEINKYNLVINFNDNKNENLVTNIEFLSDLAVENPIRIGYTFAGWDIDLPKTMPAHDLLITANWIANEYTLTLKNYYVNSDLIITKECDSEIPQIEDPISRGYDFIKWNETIPEYMPAENTTIEAYWMCHIKYNLKSNNIEIIGYNKDNNVCILNEYEGYIVTTIKENAFLNCTNLESIEIPQTISEIEKNAFKNCINLKEIKYYGTSSERNQILIADGNEILNNINWGLKIKLVGFENEKSFVPKFDYLNEYGQERQLSDILADIRCKFLEDYANELNYDDNKIVLLKKIKNSSELYNEFINNDFCHLIINEDYTVTDMGKEWSWLFVWILRHPNSIYGSNEVKTNGGDNSIDKRAAYLISIFNDNHSDTKFDTEMMRGFKEFPIQVLVNALVNFFFEDNAYLTSATIDKVISFKKGSNKYSSADDAVGTPYDPYYDYEWSFIYEISHKCNDSIVVTVDSNPYILPNIKKEGYMFVGWNTQEDGSGDFLKEVTYIFVDKTLYAIWEKEK